MTGPGVAETAASFMGLGVSQSHGKWSIKFCLRHFGASSAVRELPLHSTPVWVCLLHLLCLCYSGVSSIERELPLCSTPECICLHLRPPLSLSAYVSVHLHHLSPSSAVSVSSAMWFCFRGCRPCVQWFTSKGLEATLVCVCVNSVCGIACSKSKGLCCVVMSSCN